MSPEKFLMSSLSISDRFSFLAKSNQAGPIFLDIASSLESGNGSESMHVEKALNIIF